MPAYDLELTKRPDGGAIDLDVLKRKSWPGIRAQYLRFSSSTNYDFKLFSSSNYIALHHFYRSDGETSVAGVPRSYVKDLRNKLTFLPAETDANGWCEVVNVGSFVAVYIDQVEAEQRPVDLAQLPPLVAIEDQALYATLSRFQAILHDPQLDMPGYAETLGELVTYEIARAASRQRRQVAQQGGLSARQVRVVTDYMDSHLADKTTISELAALLDVTRFHFIRSFKRTVGMPPHHFMIRRRVDRAKELLAQPNISIAEAAAKSGFSNAVQLTRTFRRIVGTTPSVFRRDNA